MKPSDTLVLIIVLMQAVGCNSSSTESQPSSKTSAAGTKSAPVKGQVGEPPQVLYDHKTGKTNPLIWKSGGTTTSFVVDVENETNVTVYGESHDGERVFMQRCSGLEKERGDRIEMLLRDDPDPAIVEVLSCLCIHGGEPGRTETWFYNIDRDNTSPTIEHAKKRNYTREGVVYEPVIPHEDDLYLASVDATSTHACGIRKDQSVVCWGEDLADALDAPAGKFTKLSVNVLRSCGLKEDKSLVCWGDPIYLGGDEPVTPSGTFTDVAVGHSQLCVLGTEGKTECWKMSKAREPRKKGNSTAEKVLAGALKDGPLEPPEGEFVSIEAAYQISCGILKDGTIRCWGTNSDGLVSDVPKGTFSQISINAYSACGLAVDGTLACWGALVRDGHQTPKGEFTQVSLGGSHACAVANDKSIQCWGTEESKQLKAPKGEFLQVAGGDRYACALKLDQTVECWGEAGHRDSKALVTIPALY